MFGSRKGKGTFRSPRRCVYCKMQRPRFTTGGWNLAGLHFTDDDEGGIEFEVDDVFYDETGNSVLAKYWDTTTDKPEEDCEFDFILTSELRFGWGMRLVTEEQQLPQYELSEIEIRRANNIRRNREFLDPVQ